MADVNKSFQLEVIADLTRLQGDLSKIPGMTEKSAASAALKLEQQFLKGATSAGKAGVEAGSKIEQGLELAHKKARLLGGALSIISPELGASVREAGHLAGGLSLAGKAASGLYGILAGGVAIAAAAALYKIYEAIAGQIEDAEKKEIESSNEALKAEVDKATAIQFVQKAIVANERLAALEKKKIYAESWHNYVQFAETAAVGALEIAQKTAAAIAKLTGVKYFATYSDALDTLKTDLAGYLDSYDTGAIEDQIAVQKRAIDSNITLAKSYEDLKHKKKDALDPGQQALYAENQKKYDDAFVARTKKIADLEAKRDNLIKLRGKSAKEVADAQKKIDEQHQAQEAGALRATLDGFEQAAQGAAELGQILEQQGKLSQGGAIALAIVTRTAALANIAAHVGEAVAAALPLLSNPITAPYGIAAEAAAFTGGALAAAAAVAAPIPSPQFHSGGIIGYDRGGGDIPIVGQKGESMLSRATTARLGKKGVDDLNRGGSLGGALYVSTMVGHRTMDRWAVKSFSRVNSPTARAVNKAQTGVRPGRRQRL